MKLVDRMGFEPTTFAGLLLTQCECVIQTKLDDRSNHFTMIDTFLSLDFQNIDSPYQKPTKPIVATCEELILESTF